MNKTTKQNMILEAIIKAYLQDNLPIGSIELQAKMDIDISASTIRSYFQKLGNDGVLMQLHVSGGRVPTIKALQEYWVERIEIDIPIVLKNLLHVRDAVREFGIYCVLEFNDGEILSEVICVKDRFLILVFKDLEVTISYSDEAYGFLNSLIGINIYDLKGVASKVGFEELNIKLQKMMIGNILFNEGEEILYEMIKDNNNKSFYKYYKNLQSIFELDDGIYFDKVVPRGYMALKQGAKVDGEDAKMLCIGKLDTDFESFLNKAKE